MRRLQRKTSHRALDSRNLFGVVSIRPSDTLHGGLGNSKSEYLVMRFLAAFAFSGSVKTSNDVVSVKSQSIFSFSIKSAMICT